MNKILLIPIILLSLACNWKTDVKKVEGGYLFTDRCYQQVGKLRISNDKLFKSIELKDLALEKSDEVIMKWRDEAYNQHDRLLKQKRLDSWNNWLYFIGGVGLTSLAVWGAGQLK